MTSGKDSLSNSTTSGSAVSFSVITPSYNQADYIRANIEAVIDQHYPNVEHIVIDNASSDGTVDVLKDYPSLIWISEPDAGQSDAVNKACAKCSNDWIVWVNSDDVLLPGALETLARYIDSHPAASVIYSNPVHVDAHGELIKADKPNYSRWKMRHWWWGNLQLWQPGTVFRRDVFDAAGPLDKELHYAMDFDFLLKAQDKFEFDYLDADLVAFRHHARQKGHVSEVPFIEERARASRRYWAGRPGLTAMFYRVVLHFAVGSLLFVEGLRQYERGDHGEGLRLVRRGLRRNPLAVLRPEHAGFWLRKIIGRERYYRYR